MVGLPGRREQVQSVILVHSQFPQARTDLGGQFFVLDKADVAVFTQFVVGPILVNFFRLPVHRLLDLLGFIMRLDQSPGTQRLCVSKLVRAALNDIEYSPDIF